MIERIVMPLAVNEDGWITGDGSIRALPRPTIERGLMKSINGIIVHQTDSETLKSTLSSYLRANANGAHFLIDKDGTTYQVASLNRQTWHVGPLKAKCLEAHSCRPAQFKGKKASQVHHIEMQKTVPFRFPSNTDSVGIELVGKCYLDPKYIRPGMTPYQIDKLRGEKGVFETVTPAQNLALQTLIRKIQSDLHVPEDQVFSHPQVSRKNQTEASTAQWPGRR